jgi:2,4'-dihydroxyacetophenone dioxygenase
MVQSVSASDLSTLHIHAADVPWVSQAVASQSGKIEVPGVESRVLHARPDEGFVVSSVRAGPGVVSALHRHIGPSFAYTIKGAWGHDTTYAYRADTYVFETPGVIHRFYSGHEPVTEVIFVVYATLELIDPESMEVTATATPRDVVDGYFAMCEAAGLPRPNILT